MRSSPLLALSLLAGVLSLLTGGTLAEAANESIRGNSVGPDYATARVNEPKNTAHESLLASTPYAGVIQIPGRVEAENFDNGGEGVAYHDTSSVNEGWVYRTNEGVDIVTLTTETGAGGYGLGWTKPGEWLGYTVNVTQAGTYTLVARVAAEGNGGTFHIEFNGVDKTGPLSIPNTGSWTTWTKVTVPNVQLSAGQQWMRIVMDTNGWNNYIGDVDYIDCLRLQAPTPYNGVIQIPGRVEVENFDNGGEGIAYHDTSPANEGRVYRPNEGVDIVTLTTEMGVGGYGVGWTKPGEWLGYTVNVTQAGAYTVVARVASAGNGGTFHIEFNGINKTGSISIPNTGSWTTWTKVTVSNVQLSAGQQWMRIVMDTNGASNYVGDIDYIDFLLSSTSNRLRWAPPPLSNPITINLGTGWTYHELSSTQDYIIRFPNQTKTGKTHLVGGRNIVIIGGHQSVPGGTDSTILFQNQTGIVHIEGLLIDNSGQNEADAIAIGAPDATFQIQNVRAVGLRGGQSSGRNHTDVVQPWGGVKELRIDRLTGSSNYQGLYLQQALGPIGPIRIQNTNLFYQSAWPNEGGYMLWLNDCNINHVELSEVYVTPKSGSWLGKSVWPDVDNATCPAQVVNNQASWPSEPVSGVVKLGPPPGGDFVPAGVAGLNYVSPGYGQ
jgi:hypothetical protein